MCVGFVFYLSKPRSYRSVLYYFFPFFFFRLACCTFNKGVAVWGLQRTPNNEYMLNLRAKY